MSIWFENFDKIECSIQKVKQSFNNYGEHYVGVISLMPGLTSVEVIEEGIDFVTIKTNEGLMRRTNISKTIDDESVIVEFDEEYQAGRMINVKSHSLDEFTVSGEKVKHRTVLSEVKAPGFMGFFYRTFGKSSIGNSLLKSYKTFLEG